jgi:hypothetical protein
MSQHHTIINYLRTNGTLTTGEALTKLGVYALSQRVGDINRGQYGVNIRRDMVEVDSGKRVARYSIGSRPKRQLDYGERCCVCGCRYVYVNSGECSRCQ